MPRVTKQVAAKDYPASGIKKGDVYWKWKFRYGGLHRSATRPRPSQLTQGKMSGVLAAQESVEDVVIQSVEDVQAAVSALEQAAEDVQGVADDYEESRSNMEEHFPDGCPKMEELEEKVSELETLAGSIEEAKDALEELLEGDDDDDEDDSEEDIQAAENRDDEDLLERARDIIQGIEWSC